jgi:hypothetical protein
MTKYKQGRKYFEDRIRSLKKELALPIKNEPTSKISLHPVDAGVLKKFLSWCERGLFYLRTLQRREARPDLYSHIALIKEQYNIMKRLTRCIKCLSPEGEVY